MIDKALWIFLFYLRRKNAESLSPGNAIVRLTRRSVCSLQCWNKRFHVHRAGDGFIKLQIKSASAFPPIKQYIELLPMNQSFHLGLAETRGSWITELKSQSWSLNWWIYILRCEKHSKAWVVSACHWRQQSGADLQQLRSSILICFLMKTLD